MRVLDRTVVQLDLNKIGMDAGTLTQIPRDASRRPTALCWSPARREAAKPPRCIRALNELNDIETKIITTEDPIEYDIDGIDSGAGQSRHRCDVRHRAAGDSCGTIRTRFSWAKFATTKRRKSPFKAR